MRNLTQHYSDEYLMGCIAKVGGNHHKCTANVQLSTTDNQWYLNIWQDFSTGWDCDDRVIYSEHASKEECHEHYGDLPF